MVAKDTKARRERRVQAPPKGVGRFTRGDPTPTV